MLVSAAAATTEMPRWPVVFAKLTAAKVQSVSPEEAARRVESGERYRRIVFRQDQIKQVALLS